MAIPLVVWIVAGLAASAVAVRALSRRPEPLFTPQPIKFKPAVVPSRVVTTRYGVSYQTGPAYVETAPQIPADVLAAVAGKLIYGGAFDEYLASVNEWARGGRELAEQHRGSIVSRMWQSIAAGVDGFPPDSGNWERQRSRWNAIAVAIQDALTGNYDAPRWWLDQELLHTQPGYARIADLRRSAQVLTYRYQQVVYGIPCDDDWDIVWVQGHTTRQIFGKDLNRHAIGTSEAQCKHIQKDRIRFVSELLLQLGQGQIDQAGYERQLAAELLRVAKRKIVVWPGGPASRPFVDWGYVIGALARMLAAAARGDTEEMAGIAEEAGRKSREWSARPPGDEYGSAELAADLEAYAGELAART